MDAKRCLMTEAEVVAFVERGNGRKLTAIIKIGG
jgi:hypothetical protein